MQKRNRVTIHYRHMADITSAFGNLSLENAIRQSMEKENENGILPKDNWKERAYVREGGNGDTLLVNIFHDGESCFFGDLTLFQEKFMQPLIEKRENAAILNLEQKQAPTGLEYVHSIMYWMVIKNHVLVMQTSSVSTKQLEEYFTWFLKEKTKCIEDCGQVLLEAKLDATSVAGGIGDIKKIVVGGAPLEAMTSPVVEKEIERYEHIGNKRTWKERAHDILKVIMSEADLEKLMNNLPEGAALDVSVNIGYKTRKRKISMAPMQQALRNLPEGEVTAFGKGGKMQGKDLRLSYPCNVLVNGNLLDVNDMKRAMLEAYKYFVNNGKIEP